MTRIQAQQRSRRRKLPLVLLALVLGVLSSCKLRRVSSERAAIISLGQSAVLTTTGALWRQRGGGGGSEDGDGNGADEDVDADASVLQLPEEDQQVETAVLNDEEPAAQNAAAEPNATAVRGDVEDHDDGTKDPPRNSTTGDAPNPSPKGSRKSLRKLEFLDRIALIASTLRQESAEIGERGRDQDALPSSARYGHGALDDVTPESDLSRPGRHIHVVTTAALPWFTGTAVNPLLRAAYLHRKTREINAGRRPRRAERGGEEEKEVEGGLPESPTADDERWVTLVVPWLELPEDQQELYGRVFASEGEQEAYIREWLATQGSMPDAAQGLKISWYPARYHSELRSIFAMGDIMSLLEEDELDVCVLEEPEHLNWYRAPGDGWTKRFNYVVGVVHTNYKEYASSHYTGMWTAPAIALMSSAMVRAYCHKVIKLSSVLQTYAPEKEAVSNVHGVRADFLREGIRRAELGRSGSYSEHGAGEVHAYFIGKLLWAKGLDIMLELEDYYKQCTGEYFPIDVFGSGPDEKDITRAFHGRRKRLLAAASENTTDSTGDAELSGDLSSSESEDLSDDSDASPENSSSSSTSFASFTFFSSSRIHEKAKQKLARFKEKFDSVELPKTFHELRRKPIPARFPGRVDHAEVKDYKVFVNPSISEVLCTTTAEALAMGKFAVIPVHPSNTFFLKFPNCLAYRNKFEFVANLRWALTHDPEPLTDDLVREFTWEAATDRFLAASSITYEEAARRERLGLTKLDERIAWFHNEIGKGATGDMLRKIFGAGPAAHQSRYDAERQQQKAGGPQQEEEEDEDDGLSRKFRRSSFAEALRATVADLGSFIQ